MTDPTLTEFLLARIAEDEAVANRARRRSHWDWDDAEYRARVTAYHAAQGPAQPPEGPPEIEDPPHSGDWSVDVDERSSEYGTVSIDGTDIYACGSCEHGGTNQQYADHITRWDPARVLAECEAKRRIVALHEDAQDEYGGNELISTGCETCKPPWRSFDPDPNYGEDFPCRTLRLVALPYADHRDYQEDWRP